MEEKYKQPWLDALRSGDFKQTKHQLIDTDSENGVSFCCLGVLCHINNLERTDNYTYNIPQIDGSVSQSFTGLDVSNIFGLSMGAQNELMEMNDKSEKTFSEIADWIEVNL